ncbi:MAG: glycosyltransferase family 2 protein [Eubacterium sp.]
MEKISIIVPCYNEQETLPTFHQSLEKILKRMENKYHLTFELIIVDDGSSDRTLDTVKDLEKKDSRIQYLSFSRNFGKEAAIYAGLKKSNGNYTVIIDADLQDPPELLEEMYLKIVEPKNDCVAARRVNRKGEPVVRSFFAKCFYRLVKRISKTEIVDGARDYRMMTRQMVDAVLEIKEYNRFSKGIFSWVGFQTEWIEYENVKRVSGETKWSFGKLLIYGLNCITDFTTAPLALASIMGFVFCLIAFVMICVVIVKTLIWGDPVAGYPSMICVIFFIGGVQLFCIGILGQYLSKTYLEVKKRPIYLIKEKSEKL